MNPQTQDTPDVRGHHPRNPAIRLCDGAFYAEGPWEGFAWMHEHAPVYWDDTCGLWGVAGYAELMTVEKNPDVFSNAEGIRPDAPAMPYMIDLDDPLHKKRRNLVNKGFTLRRVQDREPRIREITVELMEKARARGRFDLVRDLACWLPLIVIGDMLGVDPDHYEDLLRWSDDLVSATGSMDMEVWNRGNEAFLAYDTYQRGVIADRRGKCPMDDLVSVLTHAELGGNRLSDDELLFELLLILVGGDETTRHVITGGTYQLLTHPEQFAMLREDRSRIPGAIEEMLRWESPIKNMCRTATRDFELHGQQVRSGDRVLLLFPAANRDPRKFPDASRFDITRTPNEHIAFGFGAHFCLGASLARLELRVYLEELLERMGDLRLADDAPPPRRASNFISGIEELAVAVD
jgi:cytochrome P450 family 142 subfamily A polypeptide 1